LRWIEAVFVLGRTFCAAVRVSSVAFFFLAIVVTISRLSVTPVLQLGWVGIDLIDSDVIILIYVASSLACCCWLELAVQIQTTPNSVPSSAVLFVFKTLTSLLVVVDSPISPFDFSFILTLSVIIETILQKNLGEYHTNSPNNLCQLDSTQDLHPEPSSVVGLRNK